MPIVYKVNVLDELKGRGYTTTKLRRGDILGESVIQALRTGHGISWTTLGRLCELLDCQPGDILKYDRSPSALVPKPRKPSLPEDQDLRTLVLKYDKDGRFDTP